MPFVDRIDEQKRLKRALSGASGCLIVVYGRRRCGKSTLLQKISVGLDSIYYLADLKETSLQIQDLSREIDKLVPGFSSATKPAWDSVISNLNGRLDKTITLYLDEFPYLVQLSPELPSILQKYLDSPGHKNVNLVLCGSSQRMMHGLVMDRSAPLYGRAEEIVKIEPLKAGWICEAMSLSGVDAVEAYSVWGGVPRYWELASGFGSREDAISELVLDRNGILYEEPMRILSDDMRSAVQPYSLLSVIGQGCNKMSEIAARLEKPATSLARPLAQLIDLGYVRRELPFGEDSKSTRKSLYKIKEPFLRFHFRFLQPRKSQLESGVIKAAFQDILKTFSHHVGQVWEDLARQSVPGCGIAGRDWGPAERWWGTGVDGQSCELDLVAESLDGKSLLLGEVKWNESEMDVKRAKARLVEIGNRIPFIKKREIVPAVWVRRGQKSSQIDTILPDDVLRWLR
ncbi:MAG: hypothetical protein A2283_01865 [Lentisphaerae bacterium RIFOXYA12_FULL_48_11]|nr:MAG: hypothetical protein A2283_01865 [Lentisphaerae bacterium RIFOXYA12_FULL_48_11]